MRRFLQYVELNFIIKLLFKAGVTFDNSFFDNYFYFLRQLKNGSFLGPIFVVHEVFLVEVRIN